MKSSSSSPDNWGREVRSFAELLSRLAAGWRYEHCETWEVNQSTGWRQFWITEPDGTRHPVRTSVASAAWRKGWAKPEKRCS